MKKVIFLVGVIGLLMSSYACKPKVQNQQADPQKVALADNSENSLDWSGVYTGIVPCASCMGIQTQITLNTDHTYTLSMQYLGKEDGAQGTYSGTFQWDDTGSNITLSGGGRDYPALYKVGENVLFQLDIDGNQITGDLEQNYLLKKIDEELVNKHWVLTELSGQAVSYKTENATKASIMFMTEGNKVSGNGGCNNFTGYYRLGTGKNIYLSDMALTRKMCIQNMEIESNLSKAFPLINNYAIEEGALILKQENTALAKFVAE